MVAIALRSEPKRDPGGRVAKLGWGWGLGLGLGLWARARRANAAFICSVNTRAEASLKVAGKKGGGRAGEGKRGRRNGGEEWGGAPRRSGHRSGYRRRDTKGANSE